ncbi:MAG: hypothetical protein NT050_08360 [Verrucomicrobia bacterium]|nr:hypothetical protein [Verrucomicrobiota bacterium]
MSPLRRKTLIGVLIALAVCALWWVIPSEEERIRHVLEQAKASVSSEGKPADGLALLARMGQLTQCLTRDVEIQVDVFGHLSGNLSGLDEVRAAAAGMTQQFPGLIRLSEIQISELMPTSAKATVVASINTGSPHGQNAQEFELRFRKWEGRWYISKVATVQALRTR